MGEDSSSENLTLDNPLLMGVWNHDRSMMIQRNPRGNRVDVVPGSTKSGWHQLEVTGDGDTGTYRIKVRVNNVCTMSGGRAMHPWFGGPDGYVFDTAAGTSTGRSVEAPQGDARGFLGDNWDWYWDQVPDEDWFRVPVLNAGQEYEITVRAAEGYLTRYQPTDLKILGIYDLDGDLVPGTQGSRSGSSVTVTTQAETPAQIRSAGAAQDSGDNPVTVSWTASTGANKYQVEREKVPTTEEERDIFDVGNVTSYDDSGTEYSTKYSYRVRAGNDSGYGPWSNGARITTMRQPGTPDKPGNLTASSNDDGSISLSWTAPQGTEEVTGYSVNRRNIDDGTETEIATPDAETTSHTDSGVTAGTTYAYWVYAKSSVGDGSATSWETIEAQEPQTDPPDKPRTMSLSEDTAGEIVISWTPATTGPDATQYRVYRHVMEGNGSMELFATADAPATSYTDGTVEEETWYGYKVTAVNGGGESSANGPRSIKIKNQTPGIPEEVTRIGLSEETAGEVVVTWPPGAGGPAATGFKIFRKRLSPGGEHGSSDVEVGTAAADATSYTDQTVLAEITYEYSVRAFNHAGASGAAKRRAITTKAQSDGTPDPPDETDATQ